MKLLSATLIVQLTFLLLNFLGYTSLTLVGLFMPIIVYLSVIGILNAIVAVLLLACLYITISATGFDVKELGAMFREFVDRNRG